MAGKSGLRAHRIQSETYSSGMDGDVLTIELIALLKTALPSDRQRVDDSLKRRRSRIGTGAHKSNRFSLTATEPRVRSSARSRVKAGAHNKIVFASPRFTATAPSRPQIFDESACDQDSATVVEVVESFNPYTSLESGSYSGITYVYSLPSITALKPHYSPISRQRKHIQISDHSPPPHPLVPPQTMKLSMK